MDNIGLVEDVRLKLSITCTEDETNKKLDILIENAIATLNYKLGADIDYSKKGMEKNLFLNFCLYDWNNCSNEFDSKYINEIYQIRKKYEVLNYVKKKNKDL